MTLLGSVSQVGQGLNVAQGQVKDLATLAEKFKLALQQKEPKELGTILAQVKGLGVKAEKGFLAAAVKTEGNTLSAAATLKEAVVANLSVEQRAELAKELFAIKGLKSHFLGQASLGSKLAQYLAKMGQERPALEAPKDEMIRGAAATLFEMGNEMVVAGEGAAKALPEGGQSPDVLEAMERIRQQGGCWGRRADAPDLERSLPRPRLEPETPEQR